MFKTNRRIQTLETWRKFMDAQVAALQANEAALADNVGKLIAEVSDLQKQLAAGIDAADEAAITAVNVGLTDLVARTAAALPGASGASGAASGASGASGAASGASGAS